VRIGDFIMLRISIATLLLIAGNIWNAVLSGDSALVQQLCEADPCVVEQRGAVGDLPIHMCFLYNSKKHIELANWIMDQ
jgi:hypothetical protein